MDAEQAKQPEVPNSGTSNPRIRELLYQRARDRATLLRWNANILTLVSVNFITVVMLNVMRINSLIIALVAVFGLVIVWVFSRSQLGRLEKKFFQEEVQSYMELLTSEPPQKTNGIEPPVSASVVESPLTQREDEILIEMAAGKANKEIAGALGISAMTVKNHISHILEKLDVDDRTSAILLAIRRGWIKLD